MMMQHAGASVKLWGWAAEHATFVWNRTHISADTGMTPYEAMRGKKPSLRHLSAVWGCDAYCHVPKEQRGPLDAKAEPCVYVGHSEARNAAHVLLLSSKKIICSRDVTYRCDSFAFLRAIQLGDEEVRGALEACDTELSAEVDQQGPNAVSDQEAAAAPAPPAEWVVESIVGQRRRNGRTQYKVHWAGFGSDEDTWEPEAEVSELAAMEAWQAQRPQPRRSSRLDAANAAELQPSSSGNDGATGPDVEEPQVHMAMCALRRLQLTHEQPEQHVVMSAVAAGIAALEQQTPQTYRQAMASPDAAKWTAALNKEHQSCVDQQVWTVLRRDSLPRGANVLPCKKCSRSR
jgi:hypothetical protein